MNRSRVLCLSEEIRRERRATRPSLKVTHRANYWSGRIPCAVLCGIKTFDALFSSTGPRRVEFACRSRLPLRDISNAYYVPVSRNDNARF
ncbi:hypothetical protein EVAR_19859_1 [Eumeta japonica]|uniref:Uncharacterized protein n=1 Tax=Eumeta variegata TaxID=151549 RepID=A0A4C1USM8_EUMVA|nr:hypothetical protein EVAR_19859_1 [Eumeta japonica]